MGVLVVDRDEYNVDVSFLKARVSIHNRAGNSAGWLSSNAQKTPMESHTRSDDTHAQKNSHKETGHTTRAGEEWSAAECVVFKGLPYRELQHAVAERQNLRGAHKREISRVKHEEQPSPALGQAARCRDCE